MAMTAVQQGEQAETDRFDALALSQLIESGHNPRKHFSAEKLDELAASVREKGIIEPLVVRSLGATAKGGSPMFEIVAGARRYRAATRVGLTHAPCMIRNYTNVQVLEIMAIENGQRDDVHPLEEADGYRALMQADGAYTPKAIAAKIGKSERYVQQRLSLVRLEPKAREAFLADHLTAGHADLIARLTPADQAAALKACFDNLYGEDKERGAISVRRLNQWIDNNVRLQLTADDPQTALFPELVKAVEKPEAAATILQVAGGWLSEAMVKKTGALSSSAYKNVHGKKDRCAHAQRAVVVIGDGRGQFLDVCIAKTTCEVHWKWEMGEAARRTKTTPGAGAKKNTGAAAEKRRLEDEKRRLAIERRRAVVNQACKEFQKRLPTKPSPALLNLLAANFRCKASWADVAKHASDDLSFYHQTEFKKTAALLKPFGVDLVAIEKAIATSAAARTSASKPTKKGKAAK